MKIVFFDGYCLLCNGFVDCLMKLDKKDVLKFAFLQGEAAKKMIHHQGLNANQNPSTIIYLRNGREYKKSTAVLMVLWDLKNWLRFTVVLFIIPTFFRDFIYKMIATNRYRLFGKRESCRVPTLEEQKRFL